LETYEKLENEIKKLEENIFEQSENFEEISD
jgi:hypothetical protein